MKKCKTCGARFPDEYKFCLRCGSPAPKYPVFGTIAAGFFTGICFVLLLLAVQIAVSGILTIPYYKSFSSDSTVLKFLGNNFVPIVTIIYAIISFLLILLFFRIIGKKTFSAIGSSRFSPVAGVLIVVFGVAANFFISSALMFIPFPTNAVEQYESIYSFLSTGNIVIEFISVALFAPFIEEIFFRGMCYGSMRRVMPKWLAVIVSSAIFGATHGNLISFVYAFLFGMILAIIYEKTGSIFAPMLMHIGCNAGSYIFDLMPSFNGIYYYYYYAIILFVSLLISVISFAIILILCQGREDQTGLEASRSRQRTENDNVYFPQSIDDRDPDL